MGRELQASSLPGLGAFDLVFRVFTSFHHGARWPPGVTNPRHLSSGIEKAAPFHEK